MFKKKTNTTEQEEQGIIYSENIQIPISKGENNNALIIESNDSEVQQKYIENMPSHPCDFSRELDGYRFLNT